MKDLDYYKQKLLAVLNKKEKEEGEVNKALNYMDYFAQSMATMGTLEKGSGLPPGTKKEWPAGSGKWYVKTGQGKWIRTYNNSTSRGAKQSIAITRKKIQNAKSLDELLQIVQENKDKFTDDQGKPIDIVKELMQDVHSKHNDFKSAASGAKKAADKVMSGKKKIDEEGISNRAEDEQNKRIGSSALWDQKVKNAIKSGDADKIKEAVKNIESEYEKLSQKTKTTDEKEYLETELKRRKRDADNALKDLEDSKNAGDNFTKNELNQALKTVVSSRYDADELIDMYKNKLKANPDAKELKANLFIAEKYKELGADFDAKHKIIDGIEDGSLLKNQKKKEIKNPEKKDYWIQDSKGNRLTASDAKNKIKDNLNKIDNLYENDEPRKEMKIRDLENENDYLKDKLNSEDQKEIESEFEKHQNRSDAMKGNKNAYKGGPKDEPKKYRYYLKFRPASIGTHPSGAVNIHNFDEKQDDGSGVNAWGYVEYDHPLSQKEQDNYELVDPKGKKAGKEKIDEVKNDFQNKINSLIKKDYKSAEKAVDDLSDKFSEIIDKYDLDQETIEYAENLFEKMQRYVERRKPSISEPKTLSDIKKNYQNSKSVDGWDDEINVNGEKIQGKWKLVEAESPMASHDENTFQKTPGFPTNNGGTINDRDYEHDNAAKESVTTIAADFDDRALGFDEPIVVTNDGIVVSGNNRTMSSKLAAKNGTDKKYLEALQKKSKRFGINADELKNFKHPRIIFEIEHKGDYTTEEFAKYNKSGKKTKSTVEKAVEVSKTIHPETIQVLADKISEFDTLGDLYNNKKAAREFMDSMVINKVIGKNELAQYYTEEGGLSDNGKEFIETTLVGGIMNENNIRSLSGAGGKAIRQKLVRAIVPLIDNKGIGKEYTFNNELNKAVNIALEVATSDKFTKVQDYLDQGNLFGETVDPLTGKLAQLLHENTQKEFAEKMRELEGGLRPAANGEFDIFLGECESRNSVIDRILQIQSTVKKALSRVFDLFR